MSGEIEQAQEQAWIEVIRKMEEVYSDLIQYEIELEEKNTALEEAQRFITSVLSSVSDILVVCDLAGDIRQVNLAFLKLTDSAEFDLLGSPIDSVLEDGHLPLSHWLDNQQGHDREVRFKTPVENILSEPVALTVSTLLDHRGLPAGLVLSGRPVGELRRAYEALKQAQAQLVQQEKMASLGRLVAGVAHELNNPISFILGNIHVLEKYRTRLADYLDAIHNGTPKAEREKLRKTLKIDATLADLPNLMAGTNEGAQRVADIVKSLKRLSFSSGQTPEIINLTDLVTKAAEMALKGRGSKAKLSVDLPALTVQGHSGQLHQVLVNIIENAADAVSQMNAGHIQISGDTNGHSICLKIKDNGPGILPTDLTKIFDPFFSTKQVGNGTGLGLWISYGIIREHHGTISAENNKDFGATFTINLPT